MRYGVLFLRQFSCVLIVSFLICAALLTCDTKQVVARTDEILLGIEPEHNIFDQVKKYRQLAAFLSSQLGIKINLTVMSRYGEVIKRFKAKGLDGAFLSSYTAAMGMRELQLEPLVYQVNLNGESRSQGYVFARQDSGIKSVEDMKGKRIVFVDPATMEGYLFPLAFLYENGVSDVNAYFQNQFYFAGSHASAVFAVLDGRADIGTAKDTVFHDLVREDPSIGNELQIIARSAKVPEVTLCLKSELDSELKEKLKNILLQLDQTKEGQAILREFEALRFIPADKRDFELVDTMALEAKASIMEHGNGL